MPCFGISAAAGERVTQRLQLTQPAPPPGTELKPLKAKLKVSYALNGAAAASQLVTLGPEYFSG